MATVFDVAAYIIEKAGPQHPVSLQKLVYYSYSWHLVWEGERLFDQPIEAWRNGPVVKALYDHHKNTVKVSSEIVRGDVNNLTPSEKESIDAVLEAYGSKKPRELSSLSHLESPWINARERAGAKDGDSSNERLLDEDIMDFYSQLA